MFCSILSSLLKTLKLAPVLFSTPTETHFDESFYSCKKHTPLYSIPRSMKASPLFLRPTKSYLWWKPSPDVKLKIESSWLNANAVTCYDGESSLHSYSKPYVDKTMMCLSVAVTKNCPPVENFNFFDFLIS